MNTKAKKILIIIIIILVIALAGLLIYQFLLKPSIDEGNGIFGIFPSNKESEIIPGRENGEENGDITPKPELKIQAISKESVISPTLTNDKNNVIYFSRINGTVWQSNFDGSNLKQVSVTSLENLVDTIWSFDKTKTINVFEDNIGIVTKYFYNFEDSKALPLNKYINGVDWSMESNKIAYQYQNDFTGDNNISISNPDGSNFSILLTTRMKDLAINWPKGSDVFLREKPTGLAPSSLYSLNTLSRSFSKVISNIYGLSVKWSSDGQKILYSKTNAGGKNPEIFTADRNGSNKKTTNANTLAEKCVWTQDPRKIICAIPKNLNEANILPDDFYKGTFASNDVFWEINIETGDRNKVVSDSELIEIYDAVELFLSPQESYLFFINKVNGLLYSIKLD